MASSQSSQKGSKHQSVIIAAISAFAGVVTTFIATSPALFGPDTNNLRADIQELEAENTQLSATVTELENRNAELSALLTERDQQIDRLEVINQEISKSPDLAMMLLPYHLEVLSLGPWDGTIDCGASQGGAVKELACSQIQTLLYYIDSTKYDLTAPMNQVRANLASYQREHGLEFGSRERTAGMLNKDTLVSLIQQRLTDMGEEREACEFFPNGC